jgi:type I restriction enzyme M protein
MLSSNDQPLLDGPSSIGHEAMKTMAAERYDSRYIHASDAETYRPIAEIVEELAVIGLGARETDKALGRILKQLGV